MGLKTQSLLSAHVRAQKFLTDLTSGKKSMKHCQSIITRVAVFEQLIVLVLCMLVEAGLSLSGQI